MKSIKHYIVEITQSNIDKYYYSYFGMRTRFNRIIAWPIYKAIRKT